MRARDSEVRYFVSMILHVICWLISATCYSSIIEKALVAILACSISLETTDAVFVRNSLIFHFPPVFKIQLGQA